MHRCEGLIQSPVDRLLLYGNPVCLLYDAPACLSPLFLNVLPIERSPTQTFPITMSIWLARRSYIVSPNKAKVQYRRSDRSSTWAYVSIKKNLQKCCCCFCYSQASRRYCLKCFNITKTTIYLVRVSLACFNSGLQLIMSALRVREVTNRARQPIYQVFLVHGKSTNSELEMYQTMTNLSSDEMMIPQLPGHCWFGNWDDTYIYRFYLKI